MFRRAFPLLVLLSATACGGRQAPDIAAEEAFARLPQEIAGFHKQRPEGGAGRTTIARYASTSHASASVHLLDSPIRPGAKDGSEEPEVDEAVQVFARATAVEAAARRENATMRHFGARAAEAGPSARCLDVQVRGEMARRQIGCATVLQRRVFVVMMLAPEAADTRQGARDPLLAVTLRLIGALSGLPPEPATAEADIPLAAPPPPAPPPPARPSRPRPEPAVPAGPTWRT